jgi:arsenate reductase (thioredoxin)
LEGDEILFVCVENADRSQMVEAFAEKSGLKAFNAGTVPSGKVNQIIVEAMLEKGIDISKKVPKILTNEMIRRVIWVVTMGCFVAEVCPKPMLAQMQKKLLEWNMSDPKSKRLEEVRRIRDEIETQVEQLSKEFSQIARKDLVEQER